MNLRQIYEKLRQQAERNGQDIDEGRLRQQAWMMRDRMMFEQSFNNNNTNNTSTSSAGAGGGTLRRLPGILEMVVNTENELFFEFKVYPNSPVQLTIEWGDGNVQVENLVPDIDNTRFDISHTYSLEQDYNAKISFDNSSAITRLRFDGSGDDFSVLKTITGLQNFTNLTRLDLDDNALQSVNLSGLSNLTYVEIGDNSIVGTSTPSLTTVNLSGCVALEELRLDDSDFSAGIPDLTGLDNLRFIDVDGSLISGSVDISFLPALDDFDFSSNPGLTELIISSSQPLGLNNEYLDLSSCALTQTSVDAILVALSQNGVITNAIIDIQGGTNAAPGAAGLAAKSVLEGNGWNVIVNS